MTEKQPDYPRAFVLPCMGGCLVAVGSRYIVFADGKIYKKGSAFASQTIAHVSVYGTDLLLGTNAKLLEVQSLVDEKAPTVYATHRRFMAAIQVGPDSVLVADKFGCVRLANWKELAEESSAALTEAVTHMAHFPKDALFIEEYGWMRELASAKGVEAAPGPYTNRAGPQSREDLNKFDSGKSAGELRRIYAGEFEPGLMGHMATITALTLDGNMCITCDRDEKIRVTRLPLLHEIEAIFCGHAEFIIDAIPVGGDLIVSVGADCTLRRWSLSRVEQEWPAVELCSPPLCVRQVAAETLLIPLVSQTKCYLYNVSTGDLSVDELPSVPLAVNVVDGQLIYLDEHKVLHLRTEPNAWEQLSSDWLATEEVTYYNHWKHDRREGAPTAEERRAKRLRHAPKTGTENPGQKTSQRSSGT